MRSSFYFISITFLFSILFACHNTPAILSLPGAVSHSPSLQKKLLTRRKQLDTNYKPRTRHILSNKKAKYTNRLLLETSPYLLQHAHNPVNWYPWGNEAFLTAKRLKRPILLSIGYSTCHWCHVMEEESFEDEEIAKIINENYIAIKVDREERPDLDAIYMSAVQAINGSGGWPMTVWLNPSKKPFYAKTYIPARDGQRGVKTGFLTMLKHFKNVYNSKRTEIDKSANQLAIYISKNLESKRSDNIPSVNIVNSVLKIYEKKFDKINGGLLGHPKFPSSLPIGLLLRHYKMTNKKSTLEMVKKTLLKMSQGGIYDHIAGGFHRYSTDHRWLTPHFEKMLYDNALLAMDYLEAFQVTGNPYYKNISKEILDYVIRDMTSSDGVFFSATDADSVGPNGGREEGYYFTWTPDEIDKILLKQESALIKKYYRVTTPGNFEGNRTILSVHSSLLSKKDNTLLQAAREKLYLARKQRPSPIRDEKILTSWNGLMISAFAKASFVFNNPKYFKVAATAAQFLLKNSYKEKRLFRSYKGGHAKLNGYLDDYAFFIAALINLFEVSGNSKWLKYAIELDSTLADSFEDKQFGGNFMTSHDHESLLAREKPSYDGAEPSGNSVQLMNLLKLHLLTTKDSYRTRAVKSFQAFSKLFTTRPTALAKMLESFLFYKNTKKEIVIVLPNNSKKDSSKMSQVLRENFLPNIVFTIISEKSLKSTNDILPILKGKYSINSQTTAYVCLKGVCNLPTTKVNIFRNLLNLSSGN